MASLTDQIGGIFGSLSNGAQTVTDQIKSAIGGGATPPNSAPAQEPGLASPGSNAGGVTQEKPSNMPLYIGLGVAVIVLVILWKK